METEILGVSFSNGENILRKLEKSRKGEFSREATFLGT